MTASSPLPWYRRVYRWGQTNLTEIDPVRYDSEWWREHWRRTRIQGVIVNAGGIVAYYPSKYPLHHRAQYLGDRDLYGEIVAAAREEGLAVLARMDSNRADARFYAEHPDWFAVDASGRPYREGDLYVACVNSPYYDEQIPAILSEIVARSQPEGITDNSWSGLDRERICFCANCARTFEAATGLKLPRAKDWDSPAYRRWIVWSYARRVAIWDLNNRVTREVGGPDCLWIGMNAGDVVAQSQRFRDYRAICRRAEIIMLDSQARSSARGFQANAEAGALIHGLLGWDKLIPESMAMYQAGQPTFRVASKPEPEARLWVVAGFAGGLQPWWHHIGAYHEDRRQYRTAEPLWRWHEANEQYLVNRRPVATVGVVWSQRNVDFCGRDAAEERVSLPWRGMTNALIRARIPYLPIHADDLERAADDLALLILPNLGALSESQGASVRRFVERGGALIASGETSRYDEWGDPRPDFALADLFGAHASGAYHGSEQTAAQPWDAWGKHTYLRVEENPASSIQHPEGGATRGTAGGDRDVEPAQRVAPGRRHAVMQGFEETDILPFGGRLEVVRAEAGTVVPLTFVPPFPIYPPETAWMRQSGTSLPALVLNVRPGGGRVAYLAADLDRCFGRDNLPDHADLLANLVRWALADRLPLRVAGPGLIDCHLYQRSAEDRVLSAESPPDSAPVSEQGYLLAHTSGAVGGDSALSTQHSALILHLVNLTSAGTWRAPVHELIPVGPLRVQVRLPRGVSGQSVRLLVAEQDVPGVVCAGWLAFEVPSVTDHEVVVMT